MQDKVEMGKGEVNSLVYTPEECFSPAQFTPRSEECFYEVVDSPRFAEMDSQLIYQALKSRLRVVSFGEYLKRYIYRKAEISQPFDEVPLEEYQDIILEGFASRDVPLSFRPSTVRPRSLAKNWLTQQSVTRDVALLIGFGLKMQCREVDELLTKGLAGVRLNMNDAREYICAYCYENDYGFHKYERLMNACELLAEDEKILTLPELNDNAAVKTPEEVRDEDELLQNAAILMKTRRKLYPEQTARHQFELLYRQAREVTASILNQMEQDRVDLHSQEIERMLADSKQFYNYQKQNRIRQAKGQIRRWNADDITPTDIERTLLSAVPRDQYGNIFPIKKSTLNAQFRGKQMTRQRTEKILAGEIAVTRYDLMTLQFYTCSQQKRNARSKNAFYHDFIEWTNEILLKCGMGPMYMANPYECFLLMCILSDEPLSTYADVIEQSFTEERHEDDQ